MEEIIDSIEIEKAANPTLCLIWLHGLGADGNDFVPIVPELYELTGLSLRFVLPHAPMRPVTLNQGMQMRAWYDIEIDAHGVYSNLDHLCESRVLLEDLIYEQEQRGFAPKQIILAGFSQGGAVALYTALRHAHALAGVIALSCYLPFPERTASESVRPDAAQKIFMAHGESDTIVPIQLGLNSAQQLRELGGQVEWHQYPMAHTVSGQEINDLADWLKRLYG